MSGDQDRMAGSERVRGGAVLWQDWRQCWRAVLLWAGVIVLVCCVYLPFNASMQDAMMAKFDMLPQALRKAMGVENLGSGAGYAQTTVLGLMGWVMGAIAAISWGSQAVGGAEEAGELELILSRSISRSTLYWQRMAALTVKIGVLAAALLVGLWGWNGPAKLDLTVGHVIAGAVAFGGLELLMAATAFALGAVTGRRHSGVLAGTALAAFAYGCQVLGSQSEKRAWLLDLSPYSWAYRHLPLTNGADWWGLALLAGVSAVVAVAGWLVFLGRDLH